MLLIVSPGQVFSHCVVRTSDKGGRVCARRVRLRCHGKRPQSNSPQQLEHKHTEEHRLGGEKTEQEEEETQPTSEHRCVQNTSEQALSSVMKTYKLNEVCYG